MVIVGIVEAALRRRGNPHPWIYGWAASCLFLAPAIAFLCLRGGWGIAWSLGLALLIGPTSYPLLRNLMEAIRTGPKRRVYYEDPYADPPLHAPSYQATDFGRAVAPIRTAPARAPDPVEPPPHVFRWEGANIPEARRAAFVTGVVVSVILAGVVLFTPRPWPTPEGQVAATLVDAGYQAVRVRPSVTGDNCPPGRGAPYRWTAAGVEGEACHSNSGRVSYRVTRTWSRHPVD